LLFSNFHLFYLATNYSNFGLSVSY